MKDRIKFEMDVFPPVSMTNPPADVPPMPKADDVYVKITQGPMRSWCVDDDGTTTIERAYATLSSMYQQERAENERLREALRRARPVIHYYDPEEIGIKVNRAPRFNGLCRVIDHALTPKETTDE